MKNIFISYKYHDVRPGDTFTLFPLIKEYAKKYDNVSIVYHPNNKDFTELIYSDCKNIKVIPMGTTVDVTGYDIIIIGHSNPNWNEFYNRPKNMTRYWRTFYDQAGFDYHILKPSYNIPRNHEKENQLYEIFKNIYGNEYIFCHDTRVDKNNKNPLVPSSRDMKIEFLEKYLKDSKIPLFHPNINLYNENQKEYQFWIEWKNKVPNVFNIIDYSIIIENAKEIHICSGGFMPLTSYLNNQKMRMFLYAPFPEQGWEDYYKPEDQEKITYVNY